MIYLGVEVCRKSFKIVALSKSFTPLGQAAFRKHRTDGIKNWLQAFAGYSEQTEWFFDDRYPPPTGLIEKFGEFAEFYTVNHRMVCEVLNTFQEYSLLVTGKTRRVGKAFLLASSKRLFPCEWIQLYDVEMDRLF